MGNSGAAVRGLKRRQLAHIVGSLFSLSIAKWGRWAGGGGGGGRGEGTDVG